MPTRANLEATRLHMTAYSGILTLSCLSPVLLPPGNVGRTLSMRPKDDAAGVNTITTLDRGGTMHRRLCFSLIVVIVAVGTVVGGVTAAASSPGQGIGSRPAQASGTIYVVRAGDTLVPAAGSHTVPGVDGCRRPLYPARAAAKRISRLLCAAAGAILSRSLLRRARRL